MTKPQTLGLRKSFGFGDRLGLATPGHLAAARRSDFAPIFAQQSIREMTRTQRTPEEVMSAAVGALDRAGYRGIWGADGDHLKTPEDAQRVAAAGFCFFTIDPSAHVDGRADRMGLAELESEVGQLERCGVMPDPGWRSEYLGKEMDVGTGTPVRMERGAVMRAVVKYGRAIAHVALMAQAIRITAGAGGAFEIEVSVDETETPTSPAEHLFFGMELRRRGTPNVVSLAPRFVGEFEKGIDYRGDLAALEEQVKQHAAIARYCGPYKLSIHSGSDKFSAYPIIGRVCGDLLHVKTAGTSYLEALRVVARVAPGLMGEIVDYARGRFEVDRASYHISTTLEEVKRLRPYGGAGEEGLYLDEVAGRQLLHVTFGSVLTMGRDAKGRTFKEGILECLGRRADLHEEFLDRHFTKHLSLLNAG